jgi:hypothetical protein
MLEPDFDFQKAIISSKHLLYSFAEVLINSHSRTLVPPSKFARTVFHV